jgi:hypothetical protein
MSEGVKKALFETRSPIRPLPISALLAGYLRFFHIRRPRKTD